MPKTEIKEEPISLEEFTVNERLKARGLVRQNITKKVGDTESILGTTADVTQLNAAAILALIVSVKNSTTYDDFRTQFTQSIEAFVPFEGGADVYAQAAVFLEAISDGNIILTASLKGFPTVLAEMGERSTGVANILNAAQTNSIDLPA